MAYYRAVAHADNATAPAPGRVGVLLVGLGPSRSARSGSPMAVYAQRLTMKISALLQASFDDQVRLRLAMAYGNPSIESAMEFLAQENANKLLVLPLFPQYRASQGSVLDQTTRVLRRWRRLPETRIVNDYHYDPGRIDALAALDDADGHARVLASIATNQLQGWIPGEIP